MALRENEALPGCPRCGGSSFRRDSIFEPMQEGETTHEFAARPEAAPPEWLEEMRSQLSTGTRCLACDDGGEIVVYAIRRGWSRIGRSAAADIRLDDPSVSRRHALVVSEPGSPLRVLDDRSLNGVLVNGDPLEWGKLEDGDELTVGKYRLFVLEG